MEVIMVLAVIGLVVAVSVSMFIGAGDETVVMGLPKGPPGDLAGMTKKASREAVVLGHPVSIAFTEKGFGMIGGSGASSGLPEGMVVKYQRWNSGRRWFPTKNLNWRFYPSGISDALRFRFESSDRVVEMAFHPLTGSTTEVNVLTK
jgi:hypothetical protein